MARTPSMNKSAVGIEMFGMDEFLRELRRAPKETRKAVNRGSQVIAETVVVRVKQRSRHVFHASRYQTTIKSFRAVKGHRPEDQSRWSEESSRKQEEPAGVW